MPDENPDPLLAPDASPWSRRIAHVLDSFLKIPGTSRTVGLDPLIGLVPGAGDTVTAFMGVFIIAAAIRRRMPVRVLLRMSGNMLLNALIGALPVVGDVFSFWFKSNTRNHELLISTLEGRPEPPASPQSKWVLAGFGVLLLLLAALTALAWWLLAQAWHWMTA